jgi:hypothetical protein
MMWIGRIAACHKAARRRQSILSELSETGGGFEGRPWADAPISRRVSAFQVLAIRPKPGSQQNDAR